MKARCLNPRHERYSDYGGRGITICKRWMKFENFLEDLGEPPTGYVLDRKKNSLGYFPSNCKWSTFKESTANRKNTIWVGNERVNDMAKRTGIPAYLIYQRLRYRWTPQEIEFGKDSSPKKEGE